MKKTAVLFLAAALAFGFTASAGAQRGNPVAGLLTSFPNGGDGLSASIEALLKNASNAEQAEREARAIVQMAKRANPEQKAAIAKGIALALLDLDVTDRDLAGVIRSALRGLDPVTRAILLAMLQVEQRDERHQRRGFGRGDTPFYPGGGGGFAGGGGGYPNEISPH